MRQILHDYGVRFEATSILYDNTSAINLSKNSILYSSTKYVDVRYHFLKDHVECGHILKDHVECGHSLLHFRVTARLTFIL